MREYKERTYRERLRRDRWTHFTVTCRESDLWIAVDTPSYTPEMHDFCDTTVRELRAEMDAWIVCHPEYAAALVPVETAADAPVIFRRMAAVADTTGIGPMSAVAGAVAEYVGVALKAAFQLAEVVVENGGDIYADICEEMEVAVFAGASPLSEKVGLRLSAADAPLGICTSSGTVGPSLSFGKADAVMIVCRDVLLADSYATAFANRIQTVEDIDRVIEEMNAVKEIAAAIIIKDDRLGVTGKSPLTLF